MASQSGTPRTAPASMSWAATWSTALIRPSLASFEAIAGDRNASPVRTYTWLTVSILIRSILNVLAQVIYGLPPAPNGSPASGSGVQSPSFIGLIRDLPVAIIFGVAGFIVVVGVINFAARLLGGAGRFSTLGYTFAAYIAPLGIITSVIALIPLVSPLNVIVAVYGIVLTVRAVKVVHKFGWGQAVASSIIVWVLIALLIACIAVVGFALFGPSGGSVLSTGTVGQ